MIMKSIIEYCEKFEIERYLLLDINNPNVNNFIMYLGIRRTVAIYKGKDNLISAGEQWILSKVDNNQLIAVHNRYRDIEFDQLENKFIEDSLNGKYGEIEIIRCHNCNCVLKSLMAKQCLWCGLDWHISPELAQQGDAPEPASPAR